jgi:hypothetical protein
MHCSVHNDEADKSGKPNSCQRTGVGAPALATLGHVVVATHNAPASLTARHANNGRNSSFRRQAKKLCTTMKVDGIPDNLR